MTPDPFPSEPLMPDAPPLRDEPIPVNGAPGYVWPTWDAALRAAWKAVPDAYDQRRRTLQAAYDAGFSLREIASVVGCSPAAVHKIIGKQRGRVRMSDPAGMSRPEVPDA